MVTAIYEATRHPEWSVDDVLAYARAGGVQLAGQERAIRKFVEALKSGKVVRNEQGVWVKRGALRRWFDGIRSRSPAMAPAY